CVCTENQSLLTARDASGKRGSTGGGEPPFFFASAEDMILAKLDWWKLGSGVSNRQWNDILEMLKEKQAVLDIAYLRQSAPMLGVADLLEKAFSDAGLQTP